MYILSAGRSGDSLTLCFLLFLLLVFVRSIHLSIHQPRTFVPRALLYNDGGFDVSPDGKTLCACAEYWLPDGVDNAMELLQQQQQDDSDDEDHEEGADDGDRNRNATNDDDEDEEMRTNTTGSTDGTPAQRNNASSSASNNNNNNNNMAEETSPPRARMPQQQLPQPLPLPLRNNPTTPQTPPPNQTRPHFTLSPPSPPGRRFTGGLGTLGGRNNSNNNASGISSSGGGYQESTASIPPPPPPPPGIHHRPPTNPLSILHNIVQGQPYTDPTSQHHHHGRYVPHIVTISLDTSPVLNDLVPGRNSNNNNNNGSISTTTPKPPVSRKIRPRLGQLLEACPLDGAKASAVTCVKFSPSTNFCLIGYGVREPLVEHNGNQYHPVTALYRVKGGMAHVSTMLSGDDDVNIARFHPNSGYGFVYGTKQGRVRVLSPRPWNYYNC
jgi:activator-of-BECN1-regulated-autophagy protein 1